MFQIQRQLDFTGGENRKIIPRQAAPDQLIRAKNCVLESEGVVESRDGKVRVNTASLGAGAILSMHIYPKANGTTYLIVQHGTSLYSSTWDGSSVIASFGAAIKTGLTAATKLRSVVWKDAIIFTNGAENPFQFNGTTVADLSGSPPKSKIIKVYAGRLWFVDVANINQIRFSDLEDFDTWDALNVIKVRDDDGDFITNLSPQQGGLVIFKTRSIYTLYGTNGLNFRLTDTITVSIGCASFDGVLDDGIFMGNDNWYRFNMSAVDPVPETHTVLLDAATPTQKVAAFAVAQSEEQRYYYLIGSDIVVFDARYNGVTSWDDLNAQCFVVSDAEGYPGDLLVGDADNGIIYKITGEDDDGSTYQTFIKTGYNDQETSQFKNWRYSWPEIDALFATTQFPITYRFDVDYGTLIGQQDKVVIEDFGVWDVSLWDNALWSSQYVPITSPYWLHNVHGRYISHEFFSQNKFRFRGYQTKFEVIGRI